MNTPRCLKYLPMHVDTGYSEMNSPVGKLTLIASSKGLHAVLWDIDRENFEVEQYINQLQHVDNQPILLKTKSQLTEYFEGKRKTFDLPLAVNGTDFQIQVWNELKKIPYSKTLTYAEQAARVGDRKKARAVGTANGHNPISIIIPCHRVIGSNGKLTGFAGGLDKKAFLLQLEQNTKSIDPVFSFLN